MPIIVAVGIIAFAVLFTLMVAAPLLERKAERQAVRDRAAREQRYEECLTRTTPEVCEIHWVVLPRPSGDSGFDPQLVITPDGKVGIGMGL